MTAINKYAILISYAELIYVLNVSRSKINRLRLSSAGIPDPLFPKTVCRVKNSIYFNRIDILNYYKSNTKLFPKALNIHLWNDISHIPTIDEIPLIIENITYSLFGLEVFWYISLTVALHELLGDGYIYSPKRTNLESLKIYDNIQWKDLHVFEKRIILSTVMDIFNLDDNVDFKGIAAALKKVQQLLTLENSNFIIKWWNLRKFKNRRYRKFLKGI